MKDIYLNDILNLSESEIENSKITLSGFDDKKNKYFYYIWEESEHKDVSFCFFQTNKSYLKKNMTVFGFIQSPYNNKKYVFAGAVKILENTPVGQPCKYEIIQRYNGMAGRLWIELNTGKRFLYAFRLSTYLNKCKVISIDNVDKNVLKFKGFDNIHLNYQQLSTIISNSNSDYYKILNSIKGVYCLTDTNTGKLYIGSASGEEGIASRWSCYVFTEDGGNKELIKLNRKSGYIKKYFTYTLLEYFDKNVSSSRVLERERYWKKVFDTIKHGYNDN